MQCVGVIQPVQRASRGLPEVGPCVPCSGRARPGIAYGPLVIYVTWNHRRVHLTFATMLNEERT